MLDGTALEVVDDFQYFGVHCVKSVQIRSFFWSVFSRIHRIQSKYGKIRTRKNSVFGHFSHNIKLKIKFLNASLLSVLLYATDSYVIDTFLQNNQTQCLIIILNINKEDHVTKEHVYKLTNTQPLMNRLAKTRMSRMYYFKLEIFSWF